MKTKINPAFILPLLLASSLLKAQYAPPVGQAGTTAMHKDSTAFIGWATGCQVVRGYQDISNTSLGFTTVGDSSMATAKAQTNGVVSLGDGGSAVCTFNKPVMNGPGADFAVFENGFDDSFLELAFVEVSSDGINFFRFPAHSLTDTITQTASFGPTDATKINNLAGKYRGGYGTPFDLQELAGKANLNINAVTHIKIIDVVGSLNKPYATYDSYGRKVNDPWPTAFPSGGFDLDAVGVIYENNNTAIAENGLLWQLSIYPNPVSHTGKLNVESQLPVKEIRVSDLSGQQVVITGNKEIDASVLLPGIYIVTLVSEKSAVHKKIVVN